MVQSDNLNKSNCTDQQLQTAAIQSILNHQPTNLTFYTDGSVQNSNKDGSFAIIETTGDPLHPKVINSHTFAGPPICSSYFAEALAINKTLEILNNKHLAPHPNILICTDSKSILTHISSIHKASNPIISNIQTNLRHLQNKMNLTLQWIPSHVNIPGNEMADQAAKQGAKLSHTDCQIAFPQLNAPSIRSSPTPLLLIH